MKIQLSCCVRPDGVHITLYTDLIIVLIWDSLGKFQAQTVVWG